MNIRFINQEDHKGCRTTRSTNDVREPNRDFIYNLIKSHPQFAELKLSIDRGTRRLFGKDEAPEKIAKTTAEQYIEHTEYNAKSALSVRLVGLQNKIISDCRIPIERKDGRMAYSRGISIDWFQVEKDVEADFDYGQALRDF